MKVRGDSEELLSQRWVGGSSQGLPNGTQGYGFRSRRSTQNSSLNGRAPRLKLNLKDGPASRGKGDPTLAGVKKTLPYMQGYDRELDSSDDETGEGMAFEEQIILRMPEGHEATKTLGEWVRRREVGNEGKEVEVKFKDSRRAVFKMNDKQFSSKLVDLPAIIESHKTLDNKQMFKIADISQMLLVSRQVEEEAEVTRGGGDEQVEGLTDDFIYDHGITPPMKWARKRRFRRRIHKRTIETVEKEVERLLADDERAENVEYAMIDFAEADMSDSDDEGGRGGGDADSMASPIGSQNGAPTLAPDGTSAMSDVDDEFSQMGEGEASAMGGEDEDVDQDLQRELEEEMLLQQQEEDDEDDEDESSLGDRNRLRRRSMSRATSDDEEDDDDDEDEDEDDLFDAGDDDEGTAGVPGGDGKDGEQDDDDDDDDMDEEEKERRVRETQLEAECKEIDAMVKRKHAEVDGTNNALIKQRNLQTLKRMQTELEMKRSQLLDLKQQRREGKEAAKAEAEAQAQAQAQAQEAAEADAAAAAVAAVAASAPPARTSSSATPSAAAATTSTVALQDDAASAAAVAPEREKSAASGAARKSGPVEATNVGDMDVDEEADDAQGEDDDEEGSDGSDLFG